MPKKKKRRKADEQICYGHRVESWIRASYFGIYALNSLLHALMAQQTPDWAKQRRRTKKALTAFENAARWIRISHNVARERPAPRTGLTQPRRNNEPNDDKKAVR